jgi:AcrR family transcriptional regulator
MRSVRVRTRREQIIEAGVKVFAAKNYEAATMSEIAREAGITKRAVYRYFPSKKDLFYAVRNEVYDSIVRHLWDKLPEAETISELAEKLMIQHVRFCKQNPEIARVVINTISEASTREFRENIGALLEERVEEIETLVREGEKDGSIDPSLDPYFLSWLMVLLFFFLIYLDAVKENRVMSDGERAVSVILEPLLEALKPRKASREAYS